MKQSLTYYITLGIIKLKGLKQDFNKDPINFNKIRKDDVHQPKRAFFRKKHHRVFQVLDSLITEIGVNENSKNLLMFIHGGAFISGPAKHHWDAVKNIAQNTKCQVWMCNYPKAPENKIVKISENIDAIYQVALKNYKPNQIFLMGDSVGGTLVTSLIQRLIIKQIKLPRKIILVSPVMDASMSNLEILDLEKRDPMLSKKGVLSAKKMCAENMDLTNEMISPLYGSFKNFPPTVLFLAENDITYPDQRVAVKKLIEAKINLEIIEGKNMPHIWPLLPIMKEAKTSMNEIIRIINS